MYDHVYFLNTSAAPQITLYPALFILPPIQCRRMAWVMEEGLPSLTVRVFGNLGRIFSATRECSGANGNAQFMYMSCKKKIQTRPSRSRGAIALNPWEMAPAVFFPARNKKGTCVYSTRVIKERLTMASHNHAFNSERLSVYLLCHSWSNCLYGDRTIRQEARYLVIIWGKYKLYATFVLDDICIRLSCIMTFSDAMRPYFESNQSQSIANIVEMRPRT